MRRSLISLCVVVIACAWTSDVDADAGDEIAVIVNKENPAKTAAREDLRPIFQTIKTQWPDGVRADPINLGDETPVRQAFDLAVLGLDPDRVARYWVDRKIRGGERPPRKVATPSAVLRSVAGDKGGVGYVAVGDLNDSVKVVARVKNGRVVSP